MKKTVYVLAMLLAGATFSATAAESPSQLSDGETTAAVVGATALTVGAVALLVGGDGGGNSNSNTSTTTTTSTR